MAIQVDKMKPLLSQYDIQPEYIEEISQKTIKVYANTGTYVLKKLTNKGNPSFIDTLSTLSQQKYSSYVPIVKNRNQQFISYHNGEYYYLMPWLVNETEDELDARHQYLFKEIAKMHSRTEKEIKLNGQEAKLHYETLSKRWDETKLFYESFVDQCEQRLYLSPFELQAVTYFIEVSRAIDFSRKNLEEWSEKMEEKEKTRIVLNHGKISAHHFLYDENGSGRLTNFEQAKYGAPIDDFLLFLNRTAKTFPTQCDDCINWFYTYQKIYPYTEAEMQLFLSYLAYPDKICRVIKSYVRKGKNQSEQESNKQLVKAYWHFKNIEYFVMKIHEIEEKKKLQAETASN
ncbi:spore coat protein YsxE [Metabacillus sediminilitoris]|uniref:Spore coat protein YsxE n=1 Tax=Metabacillus sediminilitoris TaxID=2567941 RepID=A0A4S4C3X4_9BACI|nr:spore coat protein YsxE [Metabacillus sediminilitoris]QGQ47423.1 spore coat protein YsxE [Metabacillus sediminilitoris]THF81857.1 spore coat protein YsxE [Metabacillus sediminilitoris]